MKLEFPRNDATFAKSISAVVRVGDDVWVGGDEGTRAVCLRRAEGASNEPRFASVEGAGIELVAELDLPGKAENEDGELPEVDLEGMDWDAEGRYLWVVGSHSLKRKAAKFAKKSGKKIRDSENLERLSAISADGNRFLLGRFPLTVDPKGRSAMISRGSYAAGHFGARLACSARTSELLDALHDDSLLRPFLRPGHELPGKDNGIDIEGLAWDSVKERLLVGLRGPVLRGMAIVLELKLAEEFSGPDAVGQLRLQRIGPLGEPYRRHFLDLDGLSIRDLCFRDDDLLVLAGPTMPIAWPVSIYRWKNARAVMNGSERFVWQESGELELWLQEELEDVERKSDHPEALTIWEKDTLVVVCDAPSDARFEEPATITADMFKSP